MLPDPRVDTSPIRLSLEPLDDYIVIEPTDEEAETRAGLILPASAATTVPALPTTPAVVGGLLAPGSLPCVLLIQQVRFALLTGNTVWANFLSNAFVRSGCGGAAI